MGLKHLRYYSPFFATDVTVPPLLVEQQKDEGKAGSQVAVPDEGMEMVIYYYCYSDRYDTRLSPIVRYVCIAMTIHSKESADEISPTATGEATTGMAVIDAPATEAATDESEANVDAEKPPKVSQGTVGQKIVHMLCSFEEDWQIVS